MILLPTAVLLAGIFIAAASGSCVPSVNIESLTATSANISWSASCTVDQSYVLRWRYEGPCTPTTTNSVLQQRPFDPSVTSYVLADLEEYSQYLTYVDALFTAGPDRGSERHFFTTLQAPASRAPSFLNASHVNSTAVLVTWDGISCPQQNGNISLFELSITSSEASWRVRVRGEADEGGRFALTGLQPSGVYDLRVAAVNSENQIGVFSSVTTIQTMETAPTDAPQNFIIQSSMDDPARVLLFSWDPPSMPNGQITNYTLTCTTQQPGAGLVVRVFTNVPIGSSKQEEVSAFSPSTTYNCSLMATNTIGDSPLAYAAITTEDDVQLFQIFLILSQQEQCMEWVANDTQAKREDIASEVQTTVGSLCHCELPIDHFSDAQLHCVGPAENQVVFQATVHGTLHNTSSYLLTTLEEWVGGGNATVTVLGVEIQLNRSCQVPISSFGRPMCQDQEDDDSEGLPLPLWALIVAAVGGLIVALSLVLLACVCCCCVARRLRKSKNTQTPHEHEAVELQTKSVPERTGRYDTDHYYATAQISVKIQSTPQNNQTPDPNRPDPESSRYEQQTPERRREDNMDHYYSTPDNPERVQGNRTHNPDRPDPDSGREQQPQVGNREDDVDHYYSTPDNPVKVQSNQRPDRDGYEFLPAL